MFELDSGPRALRVLGRLKSIAPAQAVANCRGEDVQKPFGSPEVDS